MSSLLLSILIPTTPDRKNDTDMLLRRLARQYKFSVGKMSQNSNPFWLGMDGEEVGVLICTDDKTITIGEKRELMYERAEGKFSWQIDSDDDIADNAIEKILEAIKSNPDVDCITFQEHCVMDGEVRSSNHLLEYPDWEGDGSKLLYDGFYFHRTPFMKSVIKTEIARSVPIPHIRFGEDHQWAQALKPHLKTEIHIPHNIYFYQHQSSDFNTRYGFDK